MTPHLLFNPTNRTSLAWVLVSGISYLVGAFLYTTHYPERLAPGYFDYFGHSHQLWHLCVNTGVITHYFASTSLYLWRIQNPQCGVTA